ncbi:hypothetical protein HMPREF1985_01336 [Mitsuokella sp. oral taxon 131 str. W9106]|nr:hypothetical protein HMPREF1985_01336 [Mitsuokella sp. oral taxon 131 str. W9106]
MIFLSVLRSRPPSGFMKSKAYSKFVHFFIYICSISCYYNCVEKIRTD